MTNKFYRQTTTPFAAGRLLCGSALAVLGFAAATPALAQGGTGLETVVVTGSLIRGVAHTGSDLISLNQDDMKQVGATTVQQLLNSVPALSSFGTDGAFFAAGSQDASGSSKPSIHSIGAVVSDGTLILIDGHRIPSTGVNQVVSDPGVIPDVAIQRVEVLPDGASSLYGADAVAGVINYITRHDFTGMQTGVKFGVAAEYQTSDITQLFGHSWEGGGVVLSYEYESRSNLLASARSFTVADKRALGGTDGNVFNCGPATISQTSASSGAASNVFAYPYTGASIGSAGDPTAAPCDFSGLNSLIPAESHHATMVTLHHQLTDRITVDATLNYSTRLDNNRQPRGTLSATAFGPTGSSAALTTGSRNPFYVGNSTTGTSSEFIRYDFNDLLGPGAHIKSGAQDVFGDLQFDVDLGGGWAATFGATSGVDKSFSRSSGVVCAACANLALNGTTNSGATANTTVTSSALSEYYGLGTIVAVTRPLTTLNALDVWNPKATNKTSAQVIKELTNGNDTNSGAEQGLDDVRIKFDGPLFEMPAGEVRAALGGQFDSNYDHQISTTNNATGPSNNSARLFNVVLSRNVYSAFVELFVPLVSPEMNIPLIEKLDLDMSGRYDRYNDFGDTTNPKVGLSWTVVNGLIARASYGTSFAAPKFNSEGQKGTGVTNATSVQTSTSAFQVPSTHPNFPGSFCSVIVGPCNVTSAQQGIQINSGNPNIKPQTGTTYSAGFDVDGAGLGVLPGFHGSVSYWQVKYQNVVDRPLLADVLTTPGLQKQLFLAPPGGWDINSPQVQAVIGNLPITGNLPQTVFYIYDGFQTNAFNDEISGIDFDLKYGFDTGNYGAFTLDLNGSHKFRFDSQGGGVGSTAPFVSYLNGIHNSSSQHVMATTGRASVQWQMDSLDVAFFWNYVNPYWNPITTPPFDKATFLPTGVTGPGGYQKIHANNTFDLNADYLMPAGMLAGFSDGVDLSVHVSNILNSAPPFYSSGGGFGGASTSGYDPYNASPVGRMITFGLQKKW